MYAIEKNGVLHKMETPGLTEIGRCDLGGECSWLEFSADGLIAVRSDLQEIWVIDATTLQVQRTIRVPGVQRVATCPALHVAYVAGGEGSGHLHLTVVDLKEGVIAGQINASDYASKPPARSGDLGARPTFDYPTVTPNGSFLFCSKGDQLHLFKLEGKIASYEDAGTADRRRQPA